MNYLKNVTYIDCHKIDFQRAFRQGLLMFLPLCFGMIFNNFSATLLATIGTFANIYVFKGTFNSRLRAVTFSALGLTVAMMLGTLTSGTPLLFGICLLIVAVVPYYIFSTLNIPGPSSTFFIIAYSLSSVMPHDPQAFAFRGAMVGVGGLMAVLFVYIEIKLRKEQPEYDAVAQEFKQIQSLIDHFNDQVKFNDLTKTVVRTLISTSEILQTSRSLLKNKSIDSQRLTLLHHAAEGIYSELLELNAKGHRPIPEIISDMVSFVMNQILAPSHSHHTWKKRVDVSPEYENLVELIFKVDEILTAPDATISKNETIQSPQYWKRLRYNLTPESMNFISTVKYSVIIGIAILIALIFDFERAYWIPSPLIIAVILLCLSGALTEMLIGANYALAMFAITVQVILLSGLAQGNLTIMIAVPRLLDTTVGILIAVIGVMIIGRRLASKRLPEIIADVTRIEAQMFHTIFSSKSEETSYNRYRERLRLKLNIDNMETMYRFAYGELLSNRKRTQYLYPAMFILEQMSFKLIQALYDDKPKYLNNEAMGQYLVAFENVAKLFEQGRYQTQLIDLPKLEYYAQLRRSLMQLQNIELYDYQNHRNPNLLKD